MDIMTIRFLEKTLLFIFFASKAAKPSAFQKKNNQFIS